MLLEVDSVSFVDSGSAFRRIALVCTMTGSGAGEVTEPRSARLDFEKAATKVCFRFQFVPLRSRAEGAS